MSGCTYVLHSWDKMLHQSYLEKGVFWLRVWRASGSRSLRQLVELYPSLRIQSTLEKSWQQELEAAHGIVSTVRKQGVMDAGTQLSASMFSKDTQHRE